MDYYSHEAKHSFGQIMDGLAKGMTDQVSYRHRITMRGKVIAILG